MVKVYTRGWNSNLTYLGWMRRQKTSELYGRYTISLWLWSYSFHTDFQHKILDFSYLDLFGSFYEISRLKKSGSSIKKSWLRHSTLTLISLVFGPVLPTSKVRNFFHTAAPVTFVFYDIVKWKLSLPFLSTLLIVQLSICRLVLLSYRNNEAEISHEIEIVVSHGSRGEKFRG